MGPTAESLIAALILAGAYLWGRRIGQTEDSKKLWERRRRISVAAGISVAYVFVDVLPELGNQQRAFEQAMGHSSLLFIESRMYLLALLSFVLFYGLDHMVLVQKGTGPDRDRTLYWSHVAAFAAYSGLIGYLLVERAERGVLSLIAYTVAMTVHFLIVQHSLQEMHGAENAAARSWLLAGAVLAGWLLGATVPLSETMFARLFAVLAGGVMITSLNHELPGDRKGRFWPFLLGAALFATVLFASEALGGRAEPPRM